MAVRFYEEAEDRLLKFAVILAKYQGQYVFCRHRDRDTWEIPGGHREPGEGIDETARRELWEETGATQFTLRPVCAYSVAEEGNFGGEETFGMLYFAQIQEREAELHSEIGEVALLSHLPKRLTYPTIQPALMEEAARRGFL